MSHPRLVFKWSLTSLVWHRAQAWLLGLSQVCLALVTGNQSRARPWMRTATSQRAVAQLPGQLRAGGELAGIAQPPLRGAGCVPAAWVLCAGSGRGGWWRPPLHAPGGLFARGWPQCGARGASAGDAGGLLGGGSAGRTGRPVAKPSCPSAGPGIEGGSGRREEQGPQAAPHGLSGRFSGSPGLPPERLLCSRDGDTRAVRLLVPGETQVEAADQSRPRLEPWASPLCPGTPRGG